MASQKWILFITIFVLFYFMEETKLVQANICENLSSVSICEHSKTHIGCAVGGKIKVVEASYGRHNGHTCMHSLMGDQNCHAGNSLSIVRSRCENQVSCELFASNSVYGDPCYGTYKYLNVKYYCSPN